jgi:4-aminobutyrate aminotransferase-like enzyme
LGIELERDQAAAGAAIYQQLLEAGFVVDYQPRTATFRLFPPYVISTQEIDHFVAAFENGLVRTTLHQTP